MSDSVRPHRRQPTRLTCPWDSPGKNTGVGCHFLLHRMKVKSESEVAQKVKSLSCIRLLATPWTAAHQAPPSMRFSRQEYWSGLPLPSPLICITALKMYTLLLSVVAWKLALRKIEKFAKCSSYSKWVMRLNLNSGQLVFRIHNVNNYGNISKL